MTPPIASPQRRTLAVNGITLAAYHWRNPGRPPVLLLHGLGDCGATWMGVGDRLASRYDVVALDLRGHGDSSHPTDGYDFATVVADLEGAIAALGWTACHAIGHSLSGKLVPWWATQHRDRLLSATLVDPFLISRMPGWLKLTFPVLYRTLPFLKLMGPFPDRAAAERTARSLRQYADWTPLQQRALAANLTQKPDGTWGSKLAIAARNGFFVESMRVAGLTRPLDLPTLLVLPEQGLNRSNLQLAPCRRYLTHCTELTVPGNHWPFLTDPNAFTDGLQTFLDAIA